MFSIISISLCVIVSLSRVQSAKEANSHWLDLGRGDIDRALNLETIEGIAKNVIIFVGDGMGLTTITAGRIYSQTESGFLAFENFPHIGSIKTYNADKLVPDSCSTATALFNGIKANYKTAGVDPSVQFQDCAASLKPEARPDSIMDWAQKAGKGTGFVTTTRVTHATPSALYAHVADRDWECENLDPDLSKNCKDIARQLVEDEPGRGLNVIMGGGRQCLQSNVTYDDHDPLDTYSCYSIDGRDLINDWAEEKKGRNLRYSVVNNNQELADLDTTQTDFLLGVFANGHLKMDWARDKGPTGMPSLANMTEKALDVLENNEKGYVLMVEGGLIDFAHHRGHARQALDEVAAFNEAIELTLTKTDPKETLIIVTSDHSHSILFSGYLSRDANILDIAQESKIDKIPYTSLLYGTGGANNFQFEVVDGKASRVDPSKEDTRDFEYSQQSAVLTDEVTHSGTDVLVYAKGPMAHLFQSVHDQTYIAYVTAYAAAIGPFENRSNSSDSLHFHQIYLIVLITIIANLYYFH